MAKVRVVRFPGGLVEASARFVDVYQGPSEGGGYRRKGGDVNPLSELLNKEQAIRRARREMRYALKCIGADRLITLNYRDNMTDMAKARRDLAKFVRLCRRAFPAFVFLAVPELQKRGAIHWHIAVKGFHNVHVLRRIWYAILGCGGAKGAAVLGQVNITPGFRIWGTKSEEALDRMAWYLCKYLGKAFEWMAKGSHRWSATKDRPRPQVEGWWINYIEHQGDVLEMVYRIAAGSRAIGVRQWMSPEATFYFVSSGCAPPAVEECPF